MHDVMRV